LVRVSRRAAGDHYASVLAEREPRSGRGHDAPGYNTPGGATFPGPLSPHPNRRWPAPGRVHGRERPLNTRRTSGHKRFPFNNFTYCLTLFSKCFSSFDHSTCALSVSGQYLALEGVYLPFRAAFPNYSTRRRSFTQAWRPTRRGSHPLWRPVPGDLVDAAPEASSANYNSDPRGQISNLSCCRFTRRYWGNPCWFLFLRLLICLSSAGIPT
jgi:hypothetical protein